MVHQIGSDGKCLGCILKGKEAHPYLNDWFFGQLLPKHPNIHISWSYRGKADQEAAFAANKSHLHFPDSAHNARIAIDPNKSYNPSDESDPNSRPESLALDLFEIINGMPKWNPSLFYAIKNEIALLKLPIKWGGTWIELGDYDHFELDFQRLINTALLVHASKTA